MTGTSNGNLVRYVITEDGKVYLQGPSGGQSGFALYDDDQQWEGGIGCAKSWSAIADDDPRITPDRRTELEHVRAGLTD